MKPKDRIIVALDVSTVDEVVDLVIALAPHVGYFKVGLELINSIGGPRAVRLVNSFGGRVFYDGKLHDIPATMARSVSALADCHVDMFNIHASAGPRAIREAAAAKGGSLLLGVTVLTSFDDHECQQVYGCNVDELVFRWALLAGSNGCDGLVCSPADLPRFAGHPLLDRMVKVTPGVRPWPVEGDDQKRSMTPAEAIRAGADYLVIGRPITQPPVRIGSPVAAAKAIAQQIKYALLAAASL